MSLWSLLPAPLFFSGDINHLDDLTLSILCNSEVIDVDQDPLGKPARLVTLDEHAFILVKELEDGSLAVGLCNHNAMATQITAKWSDLGVQGRHYVRDLWRQKDIGRFQDQFTAMVPPDGVVLVKVSKKR